MVDHPFSDFQCGVWSGDGLHGGALVAPFFEVVFGEGFDAFGELILR